MVESASRDSGSLWKVGATALADLLGSGDVSSREAVCDVLERIAAINPRVNAITRVLETDALAAAGHADRELVKGRRLGPLHGVPVSVKENVDVVGSPTTHGVRALLHAYPRRDAVHIGLLRAAGAIVVSRTNLPEFASRWDTDNELYGPTLNPWMATATAGGSSGGDAVAVATGMSPLGFGNDDGGSLRYPAQCEGICSLKPSRGRVPEALAPASRSRASTKLLNVQGPMARTVADLRLALRVIGTGTPRDTARIAASSRRISDARRPCVALAPLDNVASQVSAGVLRAGQCLEQAGYTVVEAEPPRVEEGARVAATLSMWDVRAEWDRMSVMMTEDGRRHMELMLSMAGTITPEIYEGACAEQRRITEEWRDFQRRHPLILAPVSTRPAFTRGADLELAGLESIIGSMSIVVTVNLVGVPAVVVPTGIDDGLPQVAQIIGSFGREDLCLDAADALEAAICIPMPIDPRF
jgi:amidase